MAATSSTVSVPGSYQAIAKPSSVETTRGSSPALKPSVKVYLEASVIFPSGSFTAGT
ncbi:hypothetical protein [Clostridium sp.]|uniref:hypothetical protein n=1 Tax=Clostridium sp. TaxID=1506 RepID=UPI0025BADB68|nr:hypothetical protein [Clostridium sp.]